MYLKKWVIICLVGILFISCQEKKSDSKSSSTVNYNIAGEPTTINPITSTDGYATDLQDYILDTLLIKDLDTYEWKPALAESYTISPNKREFTYKIRDGVKWHDGSLLTVEDVKFSFDVIFDPKYNTAHKRPYYENIEKAEIIDSKTIKFTAKDDYFGNFDQVSSLFIIQKNYYSNPENNKDANKNLIGTGPYRLIKYEKGKRFVLEKNNEWWGRNVAHTQDMHTINKLSLRFVSDTNVALEMLKKGDLDFLGLTPEVYSKNTEGEIWNTKLEKIKTENKAPKGFSFIGWNMDHPVLKNKNVRKALALLFNRDLMKEKFEYNLSEPAIGPTYIQSDYAPKDVKAVSFNPTEALNILKSEGWKDSDGDQILDKKIGNHQAKLSFTILEPAEFMVKYLTVFKEDAKKIGVEINIKTIEWNSFIKLIDERKFEAVRLAWGKGSVDIDHKQIWHTSSIKGGSNFIGYSNPEVDRLIDLSRKEYDKSKRIPMIQKISKIIADDYPYVFYFNHKHVLYGNSRKFIKSKDTFTYSVGSSFWKLKAE